MQDSSAVTLNYLDLWLHTLQRFKGQMQACLSAEGLLGFPDTYSGLAVRKEGRRPLQGLL